MDPRSPLLERWSHFANAAGRERRPAVVDGTGTHGYDTVDLASRRVAAGLLAGTGANTLAGRRIAVLVTPGAAWVASFFGVLRAGGCVVVLSPMHPEAETRYFLEDAEVATILASPDLAPRLDALTGTRRLLLTDRLATLAPREDEPLVSAASAALQLYTSGTTGKPKGAVLSHANLGVQQAAMGRAWGCSPSDVLVHALPLHHLHGLGIALINLLGAGGCARMLPGFDAAAIWDALPSATLFMGVPTMYTKLFAAFDAADEATRARWADGARKLRLATSGSAALPVTLGERWRAITGTYPLERFGMTEIGVGMSNPLAGPRKPGMVGLPVDGVETRIVDDQGNDAASGELWVRGPAVIAEYWKREEATRAAFADGGWFKTGDTVTRDPDGWFKILGRTSVDILKSGGYKLSALEIEEVLREHPGVSEVAVVGVPDETWGDRVVACVVAREGHDCGGEILRDFAKQKLAVYKVPKDVIVCASLPRNAMGKVVKPELVKTLREAEATAKKLT